MSSQINYELSQLEVKVAAVDIPNSPSNRPATTVETKNSYEYPRVDTSNRNNNFVGKSPSNITNNKRMLMQALEEDWFALMNASNLLKQDKEVVMAAVTQNGRALDFAAQKLQDDPEVIQAAILGGRLDLATSEQCANRKIVMRAVANDGLALKYASSALKNCKNVVLVAVEQEGNALEYASGALRNDKDVVLVAVNQDGHALEYASKLLCDDKDVVLVAIAHDGSELEYASIRLKSDPDVVMVAVAQNGSALDFASIHMQSDRDVVMAAVVQDGEERVLAVDGGLWVVNTEMVELVKQQAEKKMEAKKWSWAKFLKHLAHVKAHTVVPDPIYVEKSLFCCSPTSVIRKNAIRIAHNQLFDNFILCLILINCIFMIIGSPYAPCCRPGETLAEGGTFVSSFADAQAGCALDGSTPLAAATTFESFDSRNITNCQNYGEGVGSQIKYGQSKCTATGTTLWRDLSDKGTAFPSHPALTAPDYNWPWQKTTAKCCVAVEWATTHGIYTEQKPSFYPEDGPKEVQLQPTLCADTVVLDVTRVADYVFTLFFTFEMVVKIIAMGFIVNKGDLYNNMPAAYLRDAWNWLDFIVVIAALVELAGIGSEVTVLRTFRVLRPLRTLNRAPSMKVLVRSLLRSLYPMIYVLLLMLFVLLLWGIVGTQLWNGLLHGTCQYYDPSSADADSAGFVMDPGQDGILCGLDYIVVDHPSYVNRVTAGTSPLLKMSGDSWDVISTLFYKPVDEHGLVQGKIPLWNLQDNSTTVARINTNQINARVCGDRVFGDTTWSTDRMVNISLLSGSHLELSTMMCRMGPNPNYDLSSFDNLGNAVLWIFTSITLEGWVDSMYNVNQVWSYKSPMMSFFVQGLYYTFLYLIGSMFMLNLTLAVIWEEFENERVREHDDQDHLIEQELHILSLSGISVEPQEEAELAMRQQKRLEEQTALITGEPKPDPPTGCWGPPCVRDYWYTVAISSHLNIIVTCAILINTVTMALEYHDWTLYRATYDYSKSLNSQNQLLGEALSQPMELTVFLQIANYVFTAIFIIELIIKVVGLSPARYWDDYFNKFDFVIVVFSIVDLATSLIGIDGIPGLTVLRTFRVLRVLKLAKSWKSLHDLLVTIMASLMDVTVAAALAMLMMFIFTLLGMEAFGGQWNVESFGSVEDVPRANFDSFGDGFMTVFQVLTGENWNDLLWASYKTSGTLGWGYFLALTFVGNYMIFNLFLAILLAKFEEGTEEAEQQRADLEAEAKAMKKAKKAQKAAAALTEKKESDLEKGLNRSDSRSKQSPKASPTASPAVSPTASPAVSPTKARHKPKRVWTITLLNSGAVPTAVAGSTVTQGRNATGILSTKLSHKSKCGCCREFAVTSVVVSSSSEVIFTAKEDLVVDNHILHSDQICLINYVDEEELPPDIVEEIIKCNGMSLAVLSPTNSFRLLMFDLARNQIFDHFILTLIIVSSIFLAMDEPWVSACACYDKNDPSTFADACTSQVPLSWVGYFDNGNSMGYYQFLLYSDLVITCIFTFEMIVKIIAFGFAFHEHAYLRNGWNALDFGIVLVSLVAISTGPLAQAGICGTVNAADTSLKTLRALRIFRALRPLRVIKRDPGLRLVVNSLFLAAAPIGTVILVTLLFMMILAVLAQQFFVGAVAVCNDPSALTFPDCVGSFNISGTDCSMLPNSINNITFTSSEWETFANPLHTPMFTLDSIEKCERNGLMGSKFPRIWDSLKVNFDNFGHSLTTVYEVASGEMWPDIMVTTIDARGIGQQPLPRTSPHFTFMWYFTVQFMIAFVMLNVFVGVIIEKYNENKAMSEGSGLLTNDQKIWVETMKLALNSKAKKVVLPPVMFVSVRLPIFKFVELREFDYGIMLCILVNVVFMGTSHFNQPVEMHDLLTGVNVFFNIIFSIEMILKWIGLGVQYFYNSWNQFDCFLVVLSWVAQTGLLPSSIASLFRIFRVARMVRLVRKVTGLLNLFKTLIFSLPALKNVAIIMALFLFIFSAFAMNTFGNIKHGELLNSDANFQTFFLSFNTMWRLTSGESYNGLMHDLNIGMPYCSHDKGGTVDPNVGNCGNEEWAYVIMLASFTVLNYVLVNLFIAIILDNFGDQCSMSEAEVTAEILDEFDYVWSMFDPKGTQKIKEDLLAELLMKVEYPLGLKGIPIDEIHNKSLRKHRNRMIQKLDIMAVDGMITFVQTKRALTFAAIDEDDVRWEDKIAEASGSLAMRNIDKMNRKEEDRITKQAHFKRGSSHGSNKSTRRLNSMGEEVGFYTVAEIAAVKIVQAAFKGRLVRQKWNSIIEEAIRLRLQRTSTEKEENDKKKMQAIADSGSVLVRKKPHFLKDDAF